MQDIHYLLLKYLYDNRGPKHGPTIKNLIDHKRPDQTLLGFSADIKNMLIGYESAGILTWDAEPMELKGGGFQESKKYRGLLGTTIDPKYQTLNEIYVEAALTYEKGMEYVSNIIDREETRQSVINTNKQMTWLTAILAFFAIVSAITDVIQTKLQADSNYKLPQEISPKSTPPQTQKDTVAFYHSRQTKEANKATLNNSNPPPSDSQ